METHQPARKAMDSYGFVSQPQFRPQRDASKKLSVHL